MRKNFTRAVNGISKLTSQEPFLMTSAVGSSNLAISAMSSSTGGETITNADSHADIIAKFATSIPSTPDADIATNALIVDVEPRDVLEFFFAASTTTGFDYFVFAGAELHADGAGIDPSSSSRIKWIPWVYGSVTSKSQAADSVAWPLAEKYFSTTIGLNADYTPNSSGYTIGSSPYTAHQVFDAFGYAKFMFIFGAGAAVTGPNVRLFYRGVS